MLSPLLGKLLFDPRRMSHEASILSFCINPAVLQFCILRHTLFLIFVNKLPDFITSQTGIYAEKYLLLFDEFYKFKLAADLDNRLQSVVKWVKESIVNLNASKTKLFLFNYLKESILPFHHHG